MLKQLGVNSTNKHSGMTEDQAGGAKDPVQVILCVLLPTGVSLVPHTERSHLSKWLSPGEVSHQPN